MPRGYPQADANPLREIFEKGACAYSKLPVEYSNVANDATETVAWLSGRASPSHGGGHRFKSCSDHHEPSGPSGQPDGLLRLCAVAGFPPRLRSVLFAAGVLPGCRHDMRALDAFPLFSIRFGMRIWRYYAKHRGTCNLLYHIAVELGILQRIRDGKRRRA